MDDNQKPLIVVLGLGEMGLVHAENLSKVRHIRLGIASNRVDMLHETASSLCTDAHYTDYTSAITDPNVTAVIISTEPSTHPALIIEAAHAGKHIFCEKPLGTDATSIRKALAVVKDKRVRLVTGFMRRWDDAYASAHRRIVSSAFGKLSVLKCTTGDADYPDKYRRDASPFALMKDLGVHDIDLARWFAQAEVRSVYAILDAHSYPDLLERQDGDVGLAILQMTNGTKVLIHLSRALKYGYNVTTELVCSEASFRVGDLGGTDLDMISKGKCARDVDSDFRIRFKTAFQNEIVAFAKLVLAGPEEAFALVKADRRYADGSDGLKATLVSEALVKSAETGLPVEIEYDE